MVHNSVDAELPRVIPIRPVNMLLRVVCAPLLVLLAIFILLLGVPATLLILADLLLLQPVFDPSVRVLYTGFHYLGCGLRLVMPGPALVVTDDYLEDRSGPLAAGRSLWSEIISAEHAVVVLESGVAIHLDDPDLLIRRSSGIRRALQYGNYYLFRTPVFIPALCTAISTDELIDIIYAHIGKQREFRSTQAPVETPA